MDKRNTYWKLVRDHHEYHYETDLYCFLADIAERMRKEGRGPLDCAQQLHKALVNALRDRRGFED